MPRVSSLASAASTLQAACDLVGEASNLSSLSRMKSFGEGVCTCARCMRRAGPIREDVENKLVQITYALANVYDDSPELDLLVTDEHRTRAQDMMACVESGDVTRLREAFLEIEEAEAEGILEPGTAPEIATYLIISAAQVGQPEVIRLLAEWDADMEESDSIRRGRPLMHAANNGHTAAVKALVDCGADPEATDDNGYTALMVAVFSDRSSAAEALLDGGAHVDTKDRAGRTALSYAAMYGSTDCIYLLAARGADVAHIDTDGNTPLELAEGSGRQSAVDALKKLQLRVKMQEKRKVKQSKVRSGCADMNAAELRAKEQEAARAAAELLEQLEKEEAAKSAKAAKKKKKVKGKGAAAEDGAEGGPDADGVAADAVPEQQHAAQPKQRHAPSGRLQQQQPHAANGSLTAWDSQQQQQQHEAAGSRRHSKEDHRPAPGHKQQQQQVVKQAPSTPVGPGGGRTSSSGGGAQSHDAHQQQHHAAVQVTTTDHHLAPGTPAAAAAGAASGDASAASASGSACDEGEVLRREWEALLDTAARCKDAQQQPLVLARVAEMLPRCADAGISVKYGRKVLQRLQAVGPARSALQAALASQPCELELLDAALAASRICRSLLEDELVQCAEDVHADLQQQHDAQRAREEEVLRQQQHQAQQEALQRQRLVQQQAAAAAAALRKAQQVEDDRQREQLAWQQQQQQQAAAQQLQRTTSSGSSASDAAAAATKQQLMSAFVQRQQRKHQQQLQQQQAQQQQQQDAPVQAPVQQLSAIQPPLQAIGAQQQQQQQQQSLLQQQQQQQDVGMLGSLAGLQAGANQLAMAQQEQRQQLLLEEQQQQLAAALQLLNQASAAQSGLGTGLPTTPLSNRQQQQLSQLQLLQQQQQQLLAAQLQGRQQGQLAAAAAAVAAAQQRHPAGSLLGAVGSSGLLRGLGSGGGGGSSGGGGQNALPTVSQQASYWQRSTDPVMSPRSFGGLGQAVSGRLSGDLMGGQAGGGQLLPSASAAGLPAGALAELARGNSLGAVGTARGGGGSRGGGGLAALAAGGVDAGEMLMMDDAHHPAFSMAHAVLSDDERDAAGLELECRLCGEARADTACLPCGCRRMCQHCARRLKATALQEGSRCPFCIRPVDDFAIVS